MKVARPIRRMIEAWERLPGIGPKTAGRLTYFLLHFPEHRLQEMADALVGLKRDVRICSICFNVGETDPCEICDDMSRDQTTVCVVEQPLDVLAVENSGKFKGVYHVLHGVIAPLQHIGPEELRIGELMKRIEDRGEKGERIGEVILALSTTMEGEATSLYIKNQIENRKNNESGIRNPDFARATTGRQGSGEGNSEFRRQEPEGQETRNEKRETIKLTRLAQGLPLGGDVEYADAVTLGRALEGRREY